MQHGLIIARASAHTHIALIEAGVATEIHAEADGAQGALGNIYWGRVVRVLPGMQAAFVQIGIDRTAFLYVDDVAPTAVLPPLPDAATQAAPTPTSGHRTGPQGQIDTMVKAGQKMMVQVRREPLGDKGARVTARITLTGRYLVFLPLGEHVAISQRLTDPALRALLTAQLTALTLAGGGLIARTAAAQAAPGALAEEAAALRQRWANLVAQAQQSAKPRLLWAEPAAAARAVRELYHPAMEAVCVNDAGVVAALRQEVEAIAPGRGHTVQQYAPAPPGLLGQVAGDLWHSQGVEALQRAALGRHVPLPGGGSLVIEACEALTVIDVNSGKFVGKGGVEATMTQLNLEAARAIARELRLRNVGGIVVIDFVDLSTARARAQVLDALREAMATDRAKHQIYPMSPLGLVQLTRRRVRPAWREVATRPCGYCEGEGVVRAASFVAEAVLAATYLTLGRTPSPELLINVHPQVADHLAGEAAPALAALEAAMAVDVLVVGRRGQHVERFELLDLSRPGEVQAVDLRRPG